MAVISTPESVLNGTPIPSAPVLLLGLGGVGQRVAVRANEHLAQSSLALAGGVHVLADAAPQELSNAVRTAVIQLTRQRTVSKMEQAHDLRQPRFEWLRLHVLFVAALAENDAGRLRELLRALIQVKHPAVGMEIVCLLDATHPDDPNEVIPGALALLKELEAYGQEMVVRCQADWTASLRLRFYVTHPHRADGSRLDHPNLDPQSAREGAANASTTGKDSVPAPDEFEATLAAALASHVAPGPLYDCLAPPPGAGADTPPFALLGWAGDVLPRDRILHRCSLLMTADLLERTALLSRSGETAETLLGSSAPEAWQAWRLQHAERLLDRRGLLQELLTGQGGIELGTAPVQAPPRRSWFRRITESVFGDRETPSNSTPGLSVRMNLPDVAWSGADVRRWPEEVHQLDMRGAERYEEILRALNQTGKPQKIAAEVTGELAKCADICVREHLGGTEAARQLLRQAVEDAERSIRDSESIAFGRPFPGRDLGIAEQGDLPQAWERFERECRRLPGWPAVIARGLGFGALVTTAGLALTLPIIPPLAPFWTLAGGAGGAAVAAIAYGRTLGRLARLGDYVRECLRAKFGRGLFDWAQRAAGTPAHKGLYQAVVEVIEQSELPTIARFDAERRTAIAEARQPAPFPQSEGTLEYLADAEDADVLYSVIRLAVTNAELDDDARALLKQGRAFAQWRHPAFESILRQIGMAERKRRLSPWERAGKPPGELIRDILTAYIPEGEKRTAAFHAWITRRMDLLALRCMALALRPPSHPERDNAAEDAGDRSPHMAYTGDVGSVSTLVRLAVPRSFDWGLSVDASLQLQSGTDGFAVPANSAAAQISRWFGGGGSATRLDVVEEDGACCLVTIAGLTVEGVLEALGCGIGEGSLPLPDMAAMPDIAEPVTFQTQTAASGTDDARPDRRSLQPAEPSAPAVLLERGDRQAVAHPAAYMPPTSHPAAANQNGHGDAAAPSMVEQRP